MISKLWSFIKDLGENLVSRNSDNKLIGFQAGMKGAGVLGASNVGMTAIYLTATLPLKLYPNTGSIVLSPFDLVQRVE